MRDWMIYGANGYTGELIARQALRQGLRPVLAGRGAAVLALGRELGLPVRQFDLADAAGSAAGVQGMALVLNCAGPFSRTAAAMMRACLDGGAHYLDISGEYPVYEHARGLHDAARAKGVVLCPGVGFDVIPTDCLALALKQAMPDASELALGFDTASGLSPGTAKTLVENLSLGGMIRRAGQLVAVPNAWHARRIDFGFGSKLAMTLPWGDISSAYASTGIPDIRVYFPAPPAFIRISRWTDWSKFIFGYRWVQRLLIAAVDRWVHGPTAEQRARLRTAVWGEVRNQRGEVRTGRIETMNGYDLTIHGALFMMQWLMDHPGESGYWTPSKLIGWRLVEQLPGSGQVVITDGAA